MKKNAKRALARKLLTPDERTRNKPVYDSIAWQERKSEKAIKEQKVWEKAQKRKAEIEKLKKKALKKSKTK